MASNSHNITAGWEITPYVGSSGAKHFDSHVQEGTGSPGGLEKAIVLAPNTLSVILPENVVRPQQQTRRRRCLSTAKVVSVSYVSFDYFKSREDPVRYDLGMYEVGSVPEVEGKMPSLTHDQILPFPGLLKNWKRETRERPSGARDKFYFHPTCKKMFRSLVEVMNFIRSSTNTTFNEKDTNSEELRGPQRVKLSEASILPSDKKRENNGSQNQHSKSKKRRIFPVSRAMKARDQLGLEEFLADAYRNLMNLSPSSTPDEPAITKEEKKISVEAFLIDAQENLLKGFENKKHRIDPTAGSHQNGSLEEMNDKLSRENVLSQLVKNLEPSEPQKGGNPEQLNSQQCGNANADNVQARMNGLTDKEMEVVKIFTEGLGRGNHDHQQDAEDLLDYSHFLFEPIPPDFF